MFPKQCAEGKILKKMSLQKIVTEYCWSNIESALVAMDESKYDESCDPQWDPLEAHCDKLGDKALEDAECKRGWDLYNKYPEAFEAMEEDSDDDYILKKSALKKTARKMHKMQKVVSEECWRSFETALEKQDEKLYNGKCDAAFDKLEGYCDKLGDAAGKDADCMRGWGLVQKYPEFFEQWRAKS
jgi:hypothetical protein